jgi:hypothetical protein
MFHQKIKRNKINILGFRSASASEIQRRRPDKRADVGHKLVKGKMRF